MNFSLAQIGMIIQAVGDYEDKKGVHVRRIQTDSRLVEPGDLFVCITGKRLDGHSFAREAIYRGAIALVVQKPLFGISEVPFLLVQDSIKALSKLAAACRSSFQGKVIAVSGSAGKTTTKELLASILSQSSRVNKNYKNWNNLLGISLSFLSFEEYSDYWIIEAGINHLGEMQQLAEMINVDVAVINNVGKAHLEGLKSVTHVAKEKCKLMDYAMPDGLAVLSLDYPELLQEARKKDFCNRRKFFSQTKKSEYTGKYLGARKDWGGDYSLQLQKDKIYLSLNLSGEYMLENLLAAATVAYELGVNIKDIQKGLEWAMLPEHRSNCKQIGGFLLLDDCYNANPLSMYRSIQHIMELGQEMPLVFVLGDMKELGDCADLEHEKLGRELSRCNPKKVFYVGKYYSHLEKGFLQGCNDNRLEEVESEKEFIKAWRSLRLNNGRVLFKASRSCRLEKFVQALDQELKE